MLSIRPKPAAGSTAGGLRSPAWRDGSREARAGGPRKVLVQVGDALLEFDHVVLATSAEAAPALLKDWVAHEQAHGAVAGLALGLTHGRGRR